MAKNLLRILRKGNKLKTTVTSIFVTLFCFPEYGETFI
jgi:hypothetical protein